MLFFDTNRNTRSNTKSCNKNCCTSDQIAYPQYVFINSPATGGPFKVPNRAAPTTATAANTSATPTTHSERKNPSARNPIALHPSNDRHVTAAIHNTAAT